MKKKVIAGLVVAVVLFLYYYFALPVVNIHSQGMWIAVVVMIFAGLIFYAVRRTRRGGAQQAKHLLHEKGVKTVLVIGAAVVVVYLVGGLLSSTLVNADKYQKLMRVDERDFEEDIKEISYDEIPLLDKDSAALLANRKMGSMVDMVSQYEVSDLYTQINYRGTPVRVTPLRYANVIKWLTNQSDGIPAYMMIDMATQNVECIKLEEGIKYSPYEHFNRNLDRHLRFQYPTYMFAEESFEIDEEGTPYWICPVKKYTIGLFGGETIGSVILCNAVSGECKEYGIDETPQWVDRVFSAELLVEQFDYNGTLKHGFWNSILSQKDCLQTTNGYNYIAMEDDVWVYTGVTSVSGDQSNVGFVLMNQRTRETRFYSVEGAIEDSAMSSAEGQVQNLGYKSTFPLLLNISDQPTYFVALKDDAGLVKKYGMVNVQKYQIVAIGDTIAECEENYTKLLYKNKLIKEEEVQLEQKKVTGQIEKLAQAVVDGTTHYYLTLKGNDCVYDVKMSSDAQIRKILYVEEGDTVTLLYDTSDEKNKDAEALVVVKELYPAGEEPQISTKDAVDVIQQDEGQAL